MMSKKPYKILLHAKAVKELQSLPKIVKDKAELAISGLAGNPIPQEAKKLQGRMGCYRLRVGDYRILYEIHATEIVVYVIGIAHRKEVYRRILRRH